VGSRFVRLQLQDSPARKGPTRKQRLLVRIQPARPAERPVPRAVA
jgi:hypothetical protein